MLPSAIVLVTPAGIVLLFAPRWLAPVLALGLARQLGASYANVIPLG